MKNKQLKQIAREIAKYPDDRFLSNIMDGRQQRISYYTDVRSLDDAEEILLWTQELSYILKSLIAGEKIPAFVFI